MNGGSELARNGKAFVLGAALLFLVQCPSCGTEEKSNTLIARVNIPDRVDVSQVSEKAYVYVSLNDFTPKGGKEPKPWEAPLLRTGKHQLVKIETAEVTSRFDNLPDGVYGISVLIDAGRPYVRDGSSDFTAYPGDYAGGTTENVQLEGGRTIKVSVSDGMYISVPEGYESPDYLPED